MCIRDRINKNSFSQKKILHIRQFFFVWHGSIQPKTECHARHGIRHEKRGIRIDFIPSVMLILHFSYGIPCLAWHFVFGLRQVALQVLRFSRLCITWLHCANFPTRKFNKLSGANQALIYLFSFVQMKSSHVLTDHFSELQK